MTNLCYVPYSELERVRGLDADPLTRTAAFAALCRINTLYMIKRAGSGHIGTSFSCTDIVSWLFLNELRLPDGSGAVGPSDIFFSSKGHDVPAFYSALIGLGLLDFELVHRLRRLDGLPGHPEVAVPFMHTNTGSLGMGISKAKGMAHANRLKGRSGDIYVLTGDGELQEGQIWESLQPAADQGLSEITVIVDHNKVQSDILVSQTSDLGDLESKFRDFGWHVSRCDGHDMAALSNAMADLKAVTKKPKVVIADTVKGKGVSFMEHTAMVPNDGLYRFHSGAPDDESYAKGASELVARADALLAEAGTAVLTVERAPLPNRKLPRSPQQLVAAYSRALVQQAERNPDIVALDADLLLDCGLVPFKERFPERYFECGIAEQDMVSQAGGMALQGLLPIVHSFACFLSTRPNEHIYNNATEHAKIVYMASLAGAIPGGTGHSHQSVRDISALSAVPGLVMIQPSNEAEVEMALDFCINGTVESSYLRMTPLPLELPYKLPAEYSMEQGRGVTLVEGRDAVLVGYGPVMLSQAYRAAELLGERSISLSVVNLPWLNRVDSDWLREAVRGYGWVFTLDDHYVAGGQGDMILSRLSELDLDRRPRARRFGLLGIPECGTNDEVLRAHRLDADGIAEQVADAMKVTEAAHAI